METIIKKQPHLIFTIVILACTMLASTARAVTIVNNNYKEISFQIMDSYTCLVKYHEDTISAGNQITWTKGKYISPSKLCIYAQGQTPLLRDYVHVKNKGCTVTVVDAGKCQGVKIVSSPGC